MHKESVQKMNEIIEKSKNELEKIIEKLPFVWKESEETVKDTLGEDLSKFKKRYNSFYKTIIKINYNHFMVAVHRRIMGNYKTEERRLRNTIKKKKIG